MRNRGQRTALALTAVAVLAAVGWVGNLIASAAETWGSIERVALDAPPASDAGPTYEGHATNPVVDGGAPSPTPPVPRLSAPSRPPADGAREAPDPTGDAPHEGHADSGEPTPTIVAPDTTTPPSTGTPSSAPSTSDSPTTSTAPSSSTTSTLGPGPAPSTVLLVGSDSRDQPSDRRQFGDFAGARADVIVLAFVGSDDVTLLSVPRDLYVPAGCGEGRHRIGEAFSECAGRHRLAQLAVEIESVFDVDIDHAAAVDMSGFEEVVDIVGGYEICVDEPVRDRRSGLQLPEGCTDAGGETTLAWLRSRYTERLVDGAWQRQDHVSDLTRNRRQRAFLESMIDRLTELNGARQVLGVLRELAPYLTIDDDLALRDVAGWAWRHRDTEVETASIDVRDMTTAGGAAVLEPVESPADAAARAAS